MNQIMRVHTKRIIVAHNFAFVNGGGKAKFGIRKQASLRQKFGFLLDLL